jgi:signal transduction histidine kinase
LFAAAPGVPARLLRGVLLLGCLMLWLVGDTPTDDLAWIGAVALAAVASSLLETTQVGGLIGRAGEVIVWAVAVNFTGHDLSPLLPYLLAPVFAAGLLARAAGAMMAAGIAAIALLVTISVPQDDLDVKDYSIAAATWTVIALLGGLVAAWARRLQLAAGEAQSSAYEEAHSLLSQLYTVTRQLPGSLDPRTTAETLVEAVARSARFSAAAVLIRTEGDRLTPLAFRGEDRLEWDTELAGENPFADAWDSEEIQVRPVMFARGPSPLPPTDPGSALVVPIRIGDRITGLLGLETGQVDAYPAEVRAEIGELVSNAALRLETGVLFDQIRELATAEERRRLAREIHDGIAQELASLGYIIDEISAVAEEAGQPDIVEDLAGLRAEMSRIVKELRLSIFDLRSEVDRFGGLGAALSEYLRTIGTTSGFTVHLTLDESSRRLPAETEAELLRIAQEAINNARKHAGADNLWVTCRIHPPDAELVVEDDGAGLGPGRADSYGLEIMKERAARTRAMLEIRPRNPRGTYVGVRVGLPGGSPPPTTDRRGTLVPARTGPEASAPASTVSGSGQSEESGS